MARGAGVLDRGILTFSSVQSSVHEVMTRFDYWAAVLMVLGAVMVPSSGWAQDTQVPVDSAGTLYTIDAELRTAADLFPEVSGFQGAELYRLESGSYELVIRYRRGEQIRRERRTLTSEKVASLRRTVGATLRTQKRTPEREDGRYDLIAATTLHGLVEGGLVAGAVGQGGSGAAALTLGGGALGFFGPLLATRNTSVTKAEAGMTFYGGLQGYAHAVQGITLIGGTDPDGRLTAGLAALGGALEGTGGYLIARRRNWSAGHAEMVSFTGGAGNLIGLGIAAGVLGEDESAGAVRGLGGSSLLGSAMGIYLGHRMGRTGRYTTGDARIYFQTAVQGANLAGSFLALTDPSQQTAVLSLPAAGIAGGVLGRRLVRGRDFTGMQGNLVTLGAGAGSLLGLAVTVGTERGGVRAVGQALGSALGFGVTYGLLRNEARSEETAAIDWNLNVGPTLARTGEADSGPSDRIVPRVSLSASF